MRTQAIAFHLPNLPDIDAFVADAQMIVQSGRLSEGPYVPRLEGALRPWLADRDVVAVSHCPDGLIAALSPADVRRLLVIPTGDRRSLDQAAALTNRPT